MGRMVLLAMLLLVAVVTNAHAHPPSDINITFDPATKTLEAVIAHDVNDPAKHFIREVDVSLNGKEIFSKTISQQDNKETQTVKYVISDVKAGDVLSVEGYCNMSGKLGKDLTVR